MANEQDIATLKDVSSIADKTSYFSKNYIAVVKTKFDEFHTVDKWSFELQEFYTTHDCFVFDEITEIRLMRKF